MTSDSKHGGKVSGSSRTASDMAVFIYKMGLGMRPRYSAADGYHTAEPDRVRPNIVVFREPL